MHKKARLQYAKQLSIVPPLLLVKMNDKLVGTK